MHSRRWFSIGCALAEGSGCLKAGPNCGPVGRDILIRLRCNEAFYRTRELRRMQSLAQHQRLSQHPRRTGPTVSDDLLIMSEHRLPPSPSSRKGCPRLRKRRRRPCNSAWSCSGAPPTRRSELAAMAPSHLVIIIDCKNGRSSERRTTACQHALTDYARRNWFTRWPSRMHGERLPVGRCGSRCHMPCAGMSACCW